ncbi:MAG: exosome complex exonuclease Rrp41 [Candidatus Rehaiarchaeum fermentans]|nr:exosome complex exonuclease Rrp41 [Candidatus Rehaiarchaeum fermentans]
MYSRKDRQLNETRKIDIRVGTFPNASGSAVFAFGDTIVFTAVDGPKPVLPKHLEDQNGLLIKFKYDMLPFSTEERAKLGLNRRDIEISEVVKEVLEGTIIRNKLPRLMVDIYAYVISADAGTRTAAINAASLACASAGLPMHDLVCALSVGKVGDSLVADLDKYEEDYEEGATDMPVAWLLKEDKILLLQLDGEVSYEEFEKLLDLSKEKAKQIHELQEKALRGKYESKS